MRPHRGRCLCKAVTFEVDILETSVNCPCESCRRQCPAPMTTYIGVLDGNWRWTGEIPKSYASSPGVERTFCANCGSPISFRSERLSGVMHLYVNALEEPANFPPALHVAYEEKLPWLRIDDELPKRNGPKYL